MCDISLSPFIVDNLDPLNAVVKPRDRHVNAVYSRENDQSYTTRLLSCALCGPEEVIM